MWIKENITKVCVDDFAIKKRCTYGTIMIDIETHQVVDLLPSREIFDVTEWLKGYPNLKVVSRDGSVSYASAIRNANKNILQVSDRFHLTKGLSEAIKKHITSVLKTNFTIPKTGSHYDGEKDTSFLYFEKKIKPDFVTRKHNQNEEKKMAVVCLVRDLFKRGYSIRKIAGETGLARQTVNKYLNPDFNPCSACYNSKRVRKLQPFENTIKEMLLQGKPFKDIESELRNAGYDGATSTIRMYATRERKIIQGVGNVDKHTEVIERKWIIKLLYKPIEQIKYINEQQLEQVIKEYPIIGQLYDLMKSFKEILFSKKQDDITNWISEATALEIEEINSFIGGISRDIEAVKNAIRYDYNNGLAEGSVNKLKLAKRIMYGRCNFDTLKKKILLREQYKMHQQT